MFNKILIANRGEIACRVIRTAKKLGITTVAVYSAADANALHVKQADEAYYLGPAPSRESYLNIDKIIAIALKSKVQAIHPGYGFLSENAEFAIKCAQNNLVFIGPSAEVIRLMGSKSVAKNLMETANIPLVPGYHGDNQAPEFLKAQADKMGYPVLLKAAAGGGGKGMRVVTQPEEFMAELEAAKREARNAFNDEIILIEKYLQEPRHIEIQIFADSHGHVVYLFERDCSIQRRHQKVVEEAPALHLTPELREKMGTTAATAAKSINYLGAGTIEFLLDRNQQFYFMEMNTRLQVEHPVTEMITGLDLVEWQLRVAAGEPLPLQQHELSLQGHAIEVRIYAEDPDNQFLPATGAIKYLQQPQTSEHVRVDTGITQDDIISPYYDPMLAKLIVWDHDRTAALRQLKQALAHYQIVGLTTNLRFLQNVIAQPEFINGQTDTHFIDTHLTALLPVPQPVPNKILALTCLYILLRQQNKSQTAQSNDPYSPWRLADNWRLNLPAQQELRLLDQDQEYKINIVKLSYGYRVDLLQDSFVLTGEMIDHHLMRVIIDADCELQATIVTENNHLYIFCDGNNYILKQHIPISDINETSEVSDRLYSPMPGTIVAVLTKIGDSVKQGDKLMIIEAMKMEHTLHASMDGIVAAINYQCGDMVQDGVELLRFEESVKLEKVV